MRLGGDAGPSHKMHRGVGTVARSDGIASSVKQEGNWLKQPDAGEGVIVMASVLAGKAETGLANAPAFMVDRATILQLRLP